MEQSKKIRLIVIHWIAITTVKMCEPDFGFYYPGCDLRSLVHVRTWKECGRICASTPGCLYWTWAHASSSYKPLNCWLKNRLCRSKASPNFISGTRSCPPHTLPCCQPKFGLNYPGCDMKQYNLIPTWKECARLCNRPNGCKYWTWTSIGHSLPHSCWLKNSSCTGKPIARIISGKKYISTYGCD